MKAKLTKDEHKALDAKLQAEYDEKDGAHLLRVEPVDGLVLENVDGLRSALAKERNDRKADVAKLATLGDLDPAKAREALVKIEEMRSWTPQDKVDEKVKAREDQLNTKNAEALKKATDRAAALERAVARSAVGAEARRVLAGKDGKAVGSYALLEEKIERRTKVEVDDAGVAAIKVVDHRGNVAVSKRQGVTGDMTLEELIIDEMRADKDLAGAFYGSSRSGAGSQGGGGGGAGGAGIRRVRTGTSGGLAGVSIEDIASGKVEVEIAQDG